MEKGIEVIPPPVGPLPAPPAYRKPGYCIAPQNPEGRPPGSPNKVTSKARALITTICEENAEEFKNWMICVARGVIDPASGVVNKETGQTVYKYLVKPDPARAATIFLDALEYHIPRLKRVEISGDPNGAPVTVMLVDDIK